MNTHAQPVPDTPPAGLADDPVRLRSLRQVQQTVECMSRHSEALDPLNFALWFEHVGGTAPALSAQLQATVASGARLPRALAHELFLQHLATHAPDDAFDLASRVMAKTAAVSAMAYDVLQRQQAVGETLQAEMVKLRDELEQARRRSLVDSLTALPNRRAFEAEIDARIAQMASDGRPTATLLMIDIDHFKSINDTHGHSHGDRALRLVGGLLLSQVGPLTACARLGGDEFGVLLATVVLDEVRAVAEQFRQRVANSRLRPSAGSAAGNTFTVSIGAAPIARGDSAVSWLNRADQALYESKKLGRDRVTVCGGSGPSDRRRSH